MSDQSAPDEVYDDGADDVEDVPLTPEAIQWLLDNTVLTEDQIRSDWDDAFPVVEE